MGSNRWAVCKCTKCGAQSQSIIDDGVEAEAITAWNTRFQAEPRALTLSELEIMTDNDLVWVVYLDSKCNKNGWHEAKYIYNYFSHIYYGYRWLAYDRQPKED